MFEKIDKYISKENTKEKSILNIPNEILKEEIAPI